VEQAPKEPAIGRLAGRVASDLDELADHPGDQTRAAQLQRRLERAAKTASGLA
jgi:hypothetical protein